MDNVYQHFRKDEQPFIDSIQEALSIATTEYRPWLSPFLDPRQQYITEVLAASFDGVAVHQFGGVTGAERKRILLAPDYFVPEDSDYELALLQINYPQKFAELDHSHILGTLANAGVERAMFGDILNQAEVWQVVVTASMSDWVQQNVTKIGRISVRFEPVDLSAAVTPQDDWESMQTTVASLRLDAVVAHVFSISRTRAKELVEHSHVRLNFATQDRPDGELAVHDIVSVRGYGRLRVDEVLGSTKKDKLRVRFSVIHK